MPSHHHPSVYLYVHLSIGGAEGQHQNSGGAVVPAPGRPSDPAKYLEGRGQRVLQAQSSERCGPVSQGFSQPAAAPQRQHEDTGGLVRASAHGPAQEKADGRGISEKEQGAGEGTERQPGAPHRGYTGTGAPKILSGAEDSYDGDREGGKRHAAKGTMSDKDAEVDGET